MGNCSNAKAPRQKHNEAFMKDLATGEQVIVYNGRSYKINMNEIFKGGQVNLKSMQQIPSAHVIPTHTSINLDKKAQYKDQSLFVNGKNMEFVLQPFNNSSLLTRRGKGSLRDIPTAQTISPV